MKAAEDQGAVTQIIAGLNAFKEAPIDLTVNALGTSAPAILASIGAFLAGAPAAVTTATALGIGAFMGSGTVKGSIYDATKQILTEQNDLKLSPAQIEKIAVKAQEYGGKNTDMILGGTILGALGSSTGAEPIIARQLAKNIIGKAVEAEAKNAAAGVSKSAATDAAIKTATRKEVEKAAERGIVKQGAVTGAKEFGTEFLQGGQEKLAQNIAQQREGYDIPTMRGVVGQGSLEGFAGLGMGAASGGREAYTAKRELTEERLQKEGNIDAGRDVLTTTSLDREKITPTATADDLSYLMPATDKAGKALADVDADTVAAKTKADTDVADAAEKAKITIDEATAKAGELIAKVDAGEKVKLPEMRKIAKALGVQIPFGASNAKAVEILRDNVAGAVNAPAGGGAQLSTPPAADVPAGETTETKPGGMVPTRTDVGSATTGKTAQPPAITKTREQQEAGNKAYEASRKIGSGMMPIMGSGGSGNYAVPLSLFGGLDLNTPVPLFGDQTLTTVIQRGGIGIEEAVALLEGKESSKDMRSVTAEDKAKYPELFGQQAKPATAKTKAQQDEDLLNDLLGGDSSLSARRTDKQISIDEQANEMGKRYGLTRNKGEDIKEFGARLKNAIVFEKKREAQEAEGAPALSGMTDQELAGQELKKESAYQPSKDQIEAYEENREYYNENLDEGDEQLPAYKELSPDDRLVYFQENIPLGSRGTAAQHRVALQQLADFRSGVKEETGPYQVEDRETGEPLFNEDGSPMMVASPYPGETRARSIYNEARDEFSRKTGLSYAFPAWTGLSNESKKLFIDINKTNTALERDMAFRAVKKQIQADKAAETSKGNTIEAETNARREMLEAAERARKAQPGGKLAEGQTQAEANNLDILPDNILEALLKGDIQKVLTYIKESGNGTRLVKARDFFLVGAKKNKAGRVQPIFKKKNYLIRNSIAMGVFRSLASRLVDIEGLKVNVVYDSNMIYDQLARYDANTNTLYFGPNGLNEATILHELTHAATVKVIHQFFTDASKLAPHVKVAVEQLIRIASAAQARLGGKYPNAFENLYEFIAYAMTDADFQYDLAQQQVGSLASATSKVDEEGKPIEQAEELQIERESTRGETRYDGLMDNLWNSFTGTLAYMYKLFTPGAKKTAVLLPTEKSGYARVRTAEEVEAGEALEKAARGERRERREPPKELSLAEKEALAPEKLFDGVEEDEKEDARIPAAPRDYTTAYGVSNLQRSILREPGYKGNFLLEAAEMFQLILAAPEGGIEQLAGKNGLGSELSATAPAKKVSDKEQTRSGGLYSKDLKKSYALAAAEKIGGKAKAFWNRITTAKGWRLTAKEFIDRTYALRYRERQLDMAKKIERDPTKAFNNISELGDLATGEGRNLLVQYLQRPMESLKKSIADLAQLTKKDINADVLPMLHMLAEARGEPEKRHMKFVLSVPLSTKKTITHNGKKISPAQRRIDLMGDPRTGKPGIVHKIALNPTQQKQVRAELEALTKYADPLGDSPRIKNDKVRERALNKREKANQLGVMDIREDSDTYNVLGINQAEVDLRMSQFKAMDPKEQALINEVMDNIREITKQTAELNKIGNYWSYPVSNIVGIYDYQNYMPFKGLAKHSVIDELIDPEAGRSRTSRVLNQEEFAAHGRFSVSDNPILQTMSDAFRASGRAGRRNFMQAILNAVKPNKYNLTGTGIIDGEVVAKIGFNERETTDMSQYQGKSYIFVYSPDGSINIIKINDKEILSALRYQYQQNGFFVDMANQLTSFFGSMHTRWNINFAPKNFVSDTLQNAWNIGAGKLGILKSAQYLGEVATAVTKNGLGKAMEVSILFEKGDPVSNRMIADMVKKDPFVRDMVEMLRIGGKNSYLMSFSLKSSLEQLQEQVDRNGVLKTVDGANKVADIWNNMFEFTSKAAAYQIYKREFLKEEITRGTSNDKGGKEMSPAEHAAAIRAAAMTKNLTNFELVGEKSKYMTAGYMFFKASAVSAARTVEAISPALRPMKWAESQLPPEVRNDATALDNWRKEYAILQTNASIMAGAMIGLGYATYFLSMLGAPDDEWDRNTVKYDNMQQWTRYARFHLPNEVSKSVGLGKDIVFQVPWGFGLGSLASMGAQIAGMVHGQSNFKDGLSNIVMGSLADAFLPLPISKIPWTEKPGQAAIDSLMPSVLRPAIEFYMNTDGIGRGINSTMNRRMGDAYVGSDRIPEAYKAAADYLFRVSDGYISWTPNTMYFFANSYLDGVSRIGEIGYSWANIEGNKKEFNPKTDLPLFGSFFGVKSNVDAREYGNIEQKIKEMDTRLYTLGKQHPERVAAYETKHPFDKAIIAAYKARQGDLNEMRNKANKIRWDKVLSPKDKTELLRVIIQEENMIKHAMVMDFKAYGMEP
jgi:hypothetical protein